MKWFRLSVTTRQLIIFGLLVALLWVGSKPVPGPDGRIVCVSTDYPTRVDFPRSEPYLKGTNVSISAFVISDQKLVTCSKLSQIPITDALKLQPNETLRRLCDLFPSLRTFPWIETRIRGRWAYYFALTLHEWEVLEDARRSKYHLLFVPEK